MCGLFNDAVSSPDCIASNDRMIKLLVENRERLYAVLS
jgi:hypothetical protein